MVTMNSPSTSRILFVTLLFAAAELITVTIASSENETSPVKRSESSRLYTLEHTEVTSTRYLGEACQSSAACRRGARDSICHQGVCTCLPYHVAFNASSCLPTSLLGFECSSHPQCSLRVPNSGCIDGSCQCSKGYSPYRRHLCLPPAKLGHKCFSHEQCHLTERHSYCKYIIPNLYGRCYCDSSTEHIGQHCIKPKPVIGSSCSTTSECRSGVKNSICRNAICVCDHGYAIGWTSNRCIATHKGLDEPLHGYEDQVSLGQPCTTWAQCQASDSNSACINGVCQCFIEGPSSCGSNNTGCHPLTFQCRSSGRCISRSLTCNGVVDCEDGSDEECTGRPCPFGSFPCGPNHCISGMYICDGIQHCIDGSDEANCQPGSNEECPGNGFKCRDGTCVPEHAFCNSIVDCSDGSDEPEKACKREHRYPIRKKASAVGVEQLQCPVRCRNGRCRSAAVLCTGADGCGDNSDETQCQICRCPSINAV